LARWRAPAARVLAAHASRTTCCSSTPRRWSARDRGKTTRRSELADAADYGYCASHSRFFWGFRLHALFAPDRTPRALSLSSLKVGEREVCLAVLERVNRTGHLVIIGDKGYAGCDFEADAEALDASITRPRRKDERGQGPPRADSPTDRVDVQTCKHLLTLERKALASCMGCAPASARVSSP
jgi:hypothetical protein